MKHHRSGVSKLLVTTRFKLRNGSSNFIHKAPQFAWKVKVKVKSSQQAMEALRGPGELRLLVFVTKAL